MFSSLDKYENKKKIKLYLPNHCLSGKVIILAYHSIVPLISGLISVILYEYKSIMPFDMNAYLLFFIS